MNKMGDVPKVEMNKFRLLYRGASQFDIGALFYCLDSGYIGKNEMEDNHEII